MHNQDMGDTVSVEWHKGLWGGTCSRSLWSATTAVQEILWDLTGTWENLRKFTLNMSHVKSFCNSNVVLLHKSCHNVKKSFVSLKLLQRNLLPLSNNKLFLWLIVDQVELFPFKNNGLDWPGNIHILSSSERRTGQVSAKPCQHKYSVSLPCQLFIFNIHKRKNVS